MIRIACSTACLAAWLMLTPAPAAATDSAASPSSRNASQDRQERAQNLERCMRFTGPSIWFTGAACPRDTVEALCRHLQPAGSANGDCEATCRQLRAEARARLAHSPRSGQDCSPWLDFAFAQCRQGCGE